MKKILICASLLSSFASCKAQKLPEDIVAKGAELTLVSEDFKFTEGPAMAKNGDVYFTDQPNNRIVKWNCKNNTVSDFMKPAGRSNGLYIDHEGAILAAADEKNELWKINQKKEVTVLLDNFENKLFNGPNDLWLDADGGIYFTDPFYKRPWWNHEEPEQNSKRVYYLKKGANSPTVAIDDNFEQPNGIIGTPDGKKLYIADIGAKKTYVYDISETGKVTNKKLFAEMGSDGMTVDNRGNVYLTGDGVTVFNSKGEKIKHIPVPENWTANVTFGGPQQNILFITAMDSVYTLEMNVNGVRY